MTFLAPAALAGLAAISIPIAIHLLNKFRIKEVRWAAMSFLAAAVAKNQRRIQLADLLLLLLRCAIIALLALAFARPTFEKLLAGTTGASGERNVMVLLDQSGSMGQSDGVETRFDAARKDALDYLENLGNDTAAGLLLVSDTVSASVPRPSNNLALVRRSVEVARQSDRGTNFLPGILQAFETLKTYGGTREIVLFTDNQSLGWDQLDAVHTLMKENPGISLRVVPAGSDGEQNLAITNIDLDGIWPSVNTPVKAMVQVTNHTSSPVNGVRITLAVDDQPASAENIINDLAPGGTRRFPLLIQFPGPGVHLVTATIPADRLGLDNTRTFAVRVSPPHSTLIVETRRQRSPLSGTGFFLAQALAPVDPSQAQNFYLQPVTKTASQVTADELANYDVIFLCDAEPLSNDVKAALPDFIKNGGGLVVFPGNSTTVATYENAPWGDLLPALPGAPHDGLFRWESPPYAHALLGLWNESANGSLQAVQTTRIRPLVTAQSNAPEAGEPNVVLRLDTREPAIVERTFGKGKVMVFNTVPLPEWTNFPLHPAFVAFAQRLYGEVTPRPEEHLNITPGEAFTHDFNIELAKKEYFLTSPPSNGEPRSSGYTELTDGQAALRITDTEATGGYRVYFDRSAPSEIAFAVQSPAAESDLAAAPADVLTRDAAAPIAGVPEATKTAAATKTSWLPSATDLWLSLIILTAAVAILELFLALRASRAVA
ncbi:MAG: BatA domain-containing protein [Opitutaceae bacterium]|nr:BatA domain-containing protein [Opitutaceae bacterium]